MTDRPGSASGARPGHGLCHGGSFRRSKAGGGGGGADLMMKKTHKCEQDAASKPTGRPAAPEKQTLANR
ncbi:protein of unknown function [Agreia sp. COWG]|nr:protein of unknown function [Agreia sp. COWG]